MQQASKSYSGISRKREPLEHGKWTFQTENWTERTESLSAFVFQEHSELPKCGTWTESVVVGDTGEHPCVPAQGLVSARHLEVAGERSHGGKYVRVIMRLLILMRTPSLPAQTTETQDILSRKLIQHAYTMFDESRFAVCLRHLLQQNWKHKH